MDEILIIDDDIIDRQAIIRALKDKRFNFHFASNGQEARLICLKHAISIAIVDYALGNENGIEVFHELQATHPFMRGILVSGHLGYGLLTQVVESRFDDCLQKPVQSSELYESIMKSIYLIIGWRARFKQYRRRERSDEFTNTFAHCIEEIAPKSYIVNGKAIMDESSIDTIATRQWASDTYLCIDMSGVKHINSSQIGSLIGLLKGLESQNGNLALCQLSDHLCSVLKQLRLLEILHCSETPTEAFQKINPDIVSRNE